eukprot:CAMPEP_0177154180 /NCGR_PEP_ID=MMETSP0367-20130122/1499_1 /TAXON_ID=447022 ORGANISM="Scrippsiella hangoei-like, Strain SHHI-4" /NCGR_SAMPLE_ID=MMETSP0367 /ASSEMBLY_ACC=CAM_ASM_000362 /LENGTH=113 /DNA_ID=CAMNT_0018599437 /DNA_START=361 /DNA_END=700 /DNA_ORIENTATION=-
MWLPGLRPAAGEPEPLVEDEVETEERHVASECEASSPVQPGHAAFREAARSTAAELLLRPEAPLALAACICVLTMSSGARTMADTTTDRPDETAISAEVGRGSSGSPPGAPPP